MKPIEKTARDLFQLLRSRFAPVRLGNEQAATTSDPGEAVFFSFLYKEGNSVRGAVSISIANRRNLKIYFTNDMIENIDDQSRWYNFLRELRLFARSNLLGFDARDISKAALDPRDFEFIRINDTPYKQSDIEIKESVLDGTLRKSYQQFESGVRLTVNHSTAIDPSVPGARSRRIDSMFIERADGERYRVPFRHLTGARGLAAHVAAGGTPYDNIGAHIVQTVQEMQDLRDFSRLTRRAALENADANSVRNSVRNRYAALREHLKKLQNTHYYQQYRARMENFTARADTASDQDIESLREKFTRRVWDEKVERLLPTVSRALVDGNIFGETSMHNSAVNEANGSVERMIRDPRMQLVLKKDPAADRMITTMRFSDGNSLMVYALGDIAARAMGDELDALANFAGEMSDRVGSESDAFSSTRDPGYKRDKQLAMQLVKRYIDDLKRMQDDSEYAAQVRRTPEQVYGRKRKREGGMHETDQFEAWTNQTIGIFENDWSGENPIFNAIRWRIERKYPGLYDQMGKETVLDAIYDVAEFVGDVEEIGSSDISIWTQQVLDQLGVDSKKNEAVTTGTTGTTGTVGTSKEPNDAQTKRTPLARPNPQVLKTLGGGDPERTRMLRTVGDKIARGTTLNPKEREIADELAGELITTKRPAAAAQTIASSIERDAPAMQEKQLVVKNDDDDDETEDSNSVSLLSDDEMNRHMQEALSSIRRLAGL